MWLESMDLELDRDIILGILEEKVKAQHKTIERVPGGQSRPCRSVNVVEHVLCNHIETRTVLLRGP